MLTFHQTEAFTQLRDIVVAELEYLSARGQTLDWWSLDEDGEPKFLTTPPFAELYRRLHGVVLDWREAERADYKSFCLEWNEFLGQEFDLENYITHLLDGFPTAGEEVDAVVKNVFLRLWHNDLYKYRQEKYKAHTRFGEKANELENELAAGQGKEVRYLREDAYLYRKEADLFLKKANIATKRLRELGKICKPLVSPPATAYFISIVEERKVAVVLKKKTETDLAEALYHIGFLNMNPAEALNRLWCWDELPKNPATKKVIIARILSNNAAFSYDVPEELR